MESYRLCRPAAKSPETAEELLRYASKPLAVPTHSEEAWQNDSFNSERKQAIAGPLRNHVTSREPLINPPYTPPG